MLRMQLLPLQDALLDPGSGVNSTSPPPLAWVRTPLTASRVCTFKENPVPCSARQAGCPQSGRYAGAGSHGWGRAFCWGLGWTAGRAVSVAVSQAAFPVPLQMGGHQDWGLPGLVSPMSGLRAGRS